MVVLEESLDLVGSDSRCGSDATPLDTIRLRWKETSKRHSLRVLSSRGLGFVFTLDHMRAIGVRLSEYRTSIATAGLFPCDKLHSFSLDVNLLGQGLGKWEQGANGICAYPTVTVTRSARLSDDA